MKSRFIALTAILILCSIGWTFAWNYLSGQAEVKFTQILGRAQSSGVKVSCINPETSGFPFRLSISCSSPSYESKNGVGIAAANMHAQAFVYRPQHQVVDFKSPAEIKIGKFGKLQLTWETARLGSELSTNGVSGATARIEGAKLTPIDPPQQFSGLALTANRTLVSARVSDQEGEENALYLGLQSTQMEVTSPAYRLPPIDADGVMLAYDMAPIMKGKVRNPMRYWVSNGGEADIKGVSLRSGEAEIYTKGWLKLDNQGFISADLDVDAVQLIAFFNQLGAEFQQIQAIGGVLSGVIDQLGEDVTLNERPAKRVKISIRRGFVSVGLIPLFAIPQIDVERL